MTVWLIPASQQVLGLKNVVPNGTHLFEHWFQARGTTSVWIKTLFLRMVHVKTQHKTHHTTHTRTCSCTDRNQSPRLPLISIHAPPIVSSASNTPHIRSAFSTASHIRLSVLTAPHIRFLLSITPHFRWSLKLPNLFFSEDVEVPSSTETSHTRF